MYNVQYPFTLINNTSLLHFTNCTAINYARKASIVLTVE